MMKGGGDQQADESSKGRHRRHSPTASVSSSQQDVRTGSSMSTSGSSEPTDVASPVIHNPRSAALPPPMPHPPDNAAAQVRPQFLSPLDLLSICHGRSQRGVGTREARPRPPCALYHVPVVNFVDVCVPRERAQSAS